MFRIVCFVALFSAVAGCWPISTAVCANPTEGDGKRAHIRQRLVQKFDRNGNGQLDPDERAAAREAMQQRREKAGGKGPGGQGTPDPERRRKMLEKFDTDGDGKLSESERAAAKEARSKQGR